MQIEPQAGAFARRYARGEPQVVWTTLVSDLETPVSAFLKIASGRPMSFLLESVEGGAVRGRYSIIGLDPDLIWRSLGGRAEINRAARGARDAFAPCNEAPLAALRALIAESRIELPDAPLAHSPPNVKAGPVTVWPSSNTAPAEYERMVNAAKDYIAAGDVFQVVLSQRFQAPFELPPFSLYRALRRVNPAPFLYFLDFDGFA